MIFLFAEMVIPLALILVLGFVFGVAFSRWILGDGSSGDVIVSPMRNANEEIALEWTLVAGAISKSVASKLPRINALTPRAFLNYLRKYDSCSEAAIVLSVADYDLVALRDIAAMMDVTSMNAEDVLWLADKRIYSLTDLAQINAVDIQDESTDNDKLDEIQRWIATARVESLR
ncbi:MAG: hypothetical protein HWE20_05910 [Gammaproteobacteria bacterium]|nr:hypothetical protein [Gammaproteobacteria bacterium]